jgi:hypothetical protein
MTGVFYLSLTEVTTQKKDLISIRKDNKFSDESLENITIENKESSKSAENCTGEEIAQVYFLPDLIVKSALAFLGGCILSEKKFFRFGII